MGESRPTTPKRKLWPWITIAMIVILPPLALGYTGLYHIPVISQVFGASKPKDLGIHPTQADWTSVQSKTPIQVNGDTAKYSVFGEKKYSGTVNAENELTSAEITAWIQHYTTNDPDIGTTQVKFIPGGMEISTFAKRYVHAPVYVKVMVSRTGSQSVSLKVTKAKIGNLSVPEKYVKTFSDFAQKIVNEHLPNVKGFSMDQLEYKEGSRSFKGTYPQTIELGTGQWW